MADGFLDKLYQFIFVGNLCNNSIADGFLDKSNQSIFEGCFNKYSIALIFWER
jgi:hypothetical protein